MTKSIDREPKGLSLIRISLIGALFVTVGCWKPSTQVVGGQLKENFDQTTSPSLFEIVSNLKLDSDESVAETAKLTVQGQVIDTNGNPVPGASVVCWTTNWKEETVVLGRVLADKDGRYEVDASRLRKIADESESVDLEQRYEHEMKNMSPLYGMFNIRNSAITGENLNNYPVNLAAVSPNNCMGDAKAQMMFSKSRIDCNVYLNNNEGEILGKVVGSEGGKPVDGVTVSLLILEQADHSDRTVSLLPIHWKTVTSDGGKFAIRNLPSKNVAWIRLSKDGDINHSINNSVLVATSSKADFTTSKEVRPNTSLFAYYQPPTKQVFGKVVDLQGAPLEGVAIRIGDKKTTTNKAGEYTSGVRLHTDTLIQAICPKDSRFATAGAYIDWNACLKGEPQGPIQAHEGVWVTGRVVSASDRRPISDVTIRGGEYRYCGKNKPDGSFRCLVFPGDKQLRLIPAWWKESENASATVHPLSVTLKQDIALGDLPIDVGDDLAAMSVKVLLPSGEPANECAVRTRSRSQTGTFRNQTLKVNGAWTETATTNASGICSFKPAVPLGSAAYVSIAYPEVDPQYFGELELKGNQSELELKLVPARAIRGKITFNGQPFSGARLIVQNRGGGRDGFRSLRFEGTSDPDGNYEVIVPSRGSFEISLLQGVHHYEIQKGIGNDPMPVVGNDGEFIEGPTIDIIKGNGEISGRVIGANRKGYSGASIHIKPIPGKVVIGFFSPGSDGFEGEFRASGIPDGAFEIFASNGSAQSNPSLDSDVVQVKAGDREVQVKMIRNSR